MKIMILGGQGMLGHRLLATLSEFHEVWATIRGELDHFPNFPHIDRTKLIKGVDVKNISLLTDLIKKIQPEVVLNCIGIIKQVNLSKNHLESIEMNSLFPHHVAKICMEAGARFIHISTDCVFSGAKGNYKEEDFADGDDLYGRSKYLGEVGYLKNSLTIRTSIIGREITPKGSLIDWFLSNKGNPISGYQKAIFSGLPTHSLAKIIDQYILKNPLLHGIYHVAAEPISKYDLLCLVRDLYDFPVTINPDQSFKIDRSLDDSKFCLHTGYQHLSWNTLIKDLKIEHDFY